VSAGPRTAALAAILLLGATPDAAAQAPGRVFRVCTLSLARPPADPAQGARILRHTLTDLGYAEGQNIVYERRYAGGRPDRLPVIAAELAAAGCDVAVAAPTLAAVAVKTASPALPLVFFAVSDPVGSGLVQSLARPGGSATGFTHLSPEASRRRIEILKEVLPALRRVAALSDPASPAGTRLAQEAEAAARQLGLAFDLVEVTGATALEEALAAAARARAGALLVLPSGAFQASRQRLAEVALRERLPLVVEGREAVAAGALLGYGPSLDDLERRAALYVDRILSGIKPADLPVQPPARFELVVNLRTARALRLTIPQSVLLRADEVIR
jgi:putative ABC transport system substrate-binding protein